MGLSVHLQGNFECINCRRTSAALIQTRILRAEADNSCRQYQVGDSEILDGLDDYCPLSPWDRRTPLVVVVGEWDCAHCHLSWQWAKVILDVEQVAGRNVATIRELSGLQPLHAADLAGVHFVESELAALADLWARPPNFSWSAGFARWLACPVSERCERVAAGFRNWCSEVAGIELDRGRESWRFPIA
jgi:hypothetical protein